MWTLATHKARIRNASIVGCRDPTYTYFDAMGLQQQTIGQQACQQYYRPTLSIWSLCGGALCLYCFKVTCDRPFGARPNAVGPNVRYTPGGVWRHLAC